MSNNKALAEKPVVDLSVMEKVVIQGDLSSLTPQDRFVYYTKVCESLGLNPLTKPFDYLQLDGKLVLYAKRDCTDQLRKLHSVSIAIVNREKIDDVYCVTARGTTPDGRCDESIGAVPLVEKEKVWDPERYNSNTQKKGAYVPTGKMIPLSADSLANALMKAEAKAKRRVTLSLVGLGMMDESEIEIAENAERIIIEEQPPQDRKTSEPEKSTKPDQTEKPSKASNKKFEQPAKPQSPSNETGESVELASTIEPENEKPEVFRLVNSKTGTSPSGTEYAQLSIIEVTTGEKMTVLAKEQTVLETVKTLSIDSKFGLAFTLENGFKIANSINIIGDAA